MSWKNQSSRTNTGKHTFVNSNYSLSTNLISEESKILGKGLFYNDVDICGNLRVGGTLDVSDIDIELLTIENMEVSGNLLVKGTLSVSGDVDFSNNLFVAGDISCNGELHFADLTYDNLIVENKLDVSGVDISNNLSIKGTISGDYLFVDTGRIHIGKDAGQTNQGEYAVAIGYQAGYQDQSAGSVAIGNLAGYQDQSGGSVAIGAGAGASSQNQYSVAIGQGAGASFQNQNSVAIGPAAGAISQNQNSVAIGQRAGFNLQNQNSVAIGTGAGALYQNQNSVAIGYNAAGINQEQYAIAIGNLAGQSLQNQNAVAIGNLAGQINQGENAVAIGYGAGDEDQSANSIILNAQDVSLNCDSSGLFIAPIRDLGAGSSKSLFYNTGTKEVFYSTSGGGGSTFSDLTVTNDVFYDFETLTVGVSGDISSNSVSGTVKDPTKSNVLLQCLPSFGENAKIIGNNTDVDDYFGWSVAISGTGDDAVAIVGARFADGSGGNSGAAYLFDVSDGAWAQKGDKIVGIGTEGNDQFGYSVAISGTKNNALAIVGANLADANGGTSGAAYLFNISAGGWVQKGNTILGDNTDGLDYFGYSVAISKTSDVSGMAIVGAPFADGSGGNSGAAYLFDVSDGGWAQIGNKIVGNNTDANDQFGSSVAISGTKDDALAIVGADYADGSGVQSGAAYLFDVSNGGWAQIGNKIVGNNTDANDQFGSSVAISGTKAIVGAYLADGSGANSGAAYLFDVSDGGWVQKGNTILGDDTNDEDYFGRSVAISGTKAIVGAYLANASGFHSGAAYLFDVSDGGWVQKGNTILGNNTNFDDLFGRSVAISGTGNDAVAIVGANKADANAGAAYIFDYKSDTTTYHWDLSGFDNSNQELNIFYDSALNPGVKTQVNFGTNNLSTISGLKSDTLFNENGQSISTRCIGTDGKGRWRTANAAPIEDLTVNGKLDVVGGGSCTFNNLTVTNDVFYDTETITVGVLGDISSNSVSGTVKDPTKSNVLLQCLPSFGENAKILSNDISGDDQFGYSVAMSGTGNDAVAIVGAYDADASGVDSGAAYLFDISSGAWVQKGDTIVGIGIDGGDYFGFSVAITGTKNNALAIVGAYNADGSGNNSGAAYLFDISAGGWAQIEDTIVGNDTKDNDIFGWSVTISGTKDNALAIVGAYDADASGGSSGAAYLFDVSDGGWVQKGNTIVGNGTKDNDHFGNSVAISGTLAIVGANNADASGVGSGAAYLFDVSDGGWAQIEDTIVGNDTSGGDQFGYSVAISGTNAIVGARFADTSGNDSGAAYLFDVSSGGWAQIENRIVGNDTSGDDYFGHSVAISGTRAIVGAPLADPSGNNSGAAYLFDVSNGGWVQKGNTIVGNDTVATDQFGWSVAMSGTGNDAVAIVGAYLADGSGVDSGAAYIFDFNSDTTTYHWDLSGFDNSNQELNIFYDSALNPAVKTQVNFGTNNLSTISGLKSDTLFNENGQSISTRCIGTDGNGLWRTANTAPAGLAGVIEKFHYYCSGQTHTLKAGGTTSITDVTASQTLSTSYATITGSSLAYTPPSGASQVNYKFTFAYRGEDATSIIFIKCFLDGTEITVARNTFRFQGNYTESERIIEVPITINGLTDDIPNATVNTWSSSKTFHIETRDYDGSYDVILHEASIFRAGDDATTIGPLFIKPMVEITAIKF